MTRPSHTPEASSARPRPRAVVTAAVLQALLALTFAISAIEVLMSGHAAEAAAKAELVRQGLPPNLLIEHGFRFGDKGLDGTALPLAIAAVLITLAMLCLTGKRAGPLLTWIAQPVLLVAGSVIIPGQVFPALLLESAIASTGDPTLRRIDVPAVVDAAAHAYPAWLPYIAGAKLVLATLGSLVIVVLLALPAARAYFRAGSA